MPSWVAVHCCVLEAWACGLNGTLVQQEEIPRCSSAEVSAVRVVQADQYCLHVHAALPEHHYARNAQATALRGNQRLAANAQLSSCTQGFERLYEKSMA